jgi:hypothetical protein
MINLNKSGGEPMALEIRMVGSDGALVRTSEDVDVPKLPAPMVPGTMMLADYCFNGGGPWVKPNQLITGKDVAAVVYSRHGRIESMVVSEQKLHDEEQMDEALRHIRGCLMTRYPAKEGREIFMFFLPPYVKKKVMSTLK